MQSRKFDELISYFNRKVSDMDIDHRYKIELLGMISAIGIAHEKELDAPTIEPERNKGRWRRVSADRYISTASYMYKCSECGETFVGAWSFCANCGAEMRTEDIE